VNVKAARRILDQALQSLRASPLEDLGLTLAVSDLAESVAARANLRLDLDVENHPENIPPEDEQCIYQMIQDALTNVARHANARSLGVACYGKTEK
jgi:signal transduction histidine kinase